MSELADLLEPPLEFIMEQEGILLEKSGDKLLGACPFHDDTDPSFAVWRYGGREFVGCWSCGFGPTDAIGFIREYKHLDFKSALTVKRRYARAVPDDWQTTALPNISRRDGARNFAPEANQALTDNPEAAHAFLRSRDLGTDADWLIERYRFGGDTKYVVVPHYTPSGKHITALKYREVHGQLLTMEGGTLAFLYGCWLDEGQPYVFITEGESDCWKVAAFYRENPQVLVLSVPSGAKAPRQSWLNFVQDRTLAVMFDGDETGRKAAAAWGAARPCTRIVDPGDGKDACDLSNSELHHVIDIAPRS